MAPLELEVTPGSPSVVAALVRPDPVGFLQDVLEDVSGSNPD